MPRSSITLSARARPMQPHAYWVDAAGTHLALDRWRSVLLELAPEVGEAQLVWRRPTLQPWPCNAAGAVRR